MKLAAGLPRNTVARSYQLANDSRHADRAPRAAVGLGELLAGQGDVEGARAAYRLAIDSGNVEITTDATERLAALLDSETG